MSSWLIQLTLSWLSDTGQIYCRAKDEGVYLDVYLAAKGKPLNNAKLRKELSGRKRIGRRLRQLIHPSSLLLAVYSDDAESIVYVLLLTEITKLIA
jgi:hypothetical protein